MPSSGGVKNFLFFSFFSFGVKLLKGYLVIVKGSSNDIVQLPESVNFLKEGVPEIFYSSLKIKQLGETQLSNVSVILSDLRNLSCSGGTIPDYYEADIVMSCDYSSFGVTLENRSWNPGAYRYGFNGKEKDPEGLGGGGATYDYGFRIYNPNLGKFLSVDPLTYSYPWYTPYQFAGNMPIWAIDRDGLEEELYIREIERTLWTNIVTVYAEYNIKVKVVNLSTSAMSENQIRSFIEAEEKKLEAALIPSTSDKYWTPPITDVFGCWNDVTQSYAVSFSIKTQITVEFTTLDKLDNDDLVIILVDDAGKTSEGEKRLGAAEKVGGRFAVVEIGQLGKTNTFSHELVHVLGYDHTSAKGQLMSDSPYDNQSYKIPGSNQTRNLAKFLYEFMYSSSHNLPTNVPAKRDSSNIQKEIKDFIQKEGIKAKNY